MKLNIRILQQLHTDIHKIQLKHGILLITERGYFSLSTISGVRDTTPFFPPHHK